MRKKKEVQNKIIRMERKGVKMIGKFFTDVIEKKSKLV